MVSDQRLVCSEMIEANAKAEEMEKKLAQTAGVETAEQQLALTTDLQERVPSDCCSVVAF